MVQPILKIHKMQKHSKKGSTPRESLNRFNFGFDSVILQIA